MRTADLHELIAQLEADASLFEPDQLRRRIDALDLLDAYSAGPGPQAMCADALRTRLEAANASAYDSIRDAVRGRMQDGAIDDAPWDDAHRNNTLAAWIERCADPMQTDPAGSGYDWLDELIGGVLRLREPESANIRPGPEMVFYQPTPARHILHMLRLCALCAADVLVDLGSGLGHVPILAALLTPARCVGIEMEPAYIATARACARGLGVSRAEFLEQDARAADLSTGTVFYLYTPFTGSILANVLSGLRQQSAQRVLRICTFGPCTQTVAREPWLTAHATPEASRITLFQTRG
jgi:Methyltransferase domain